MSVDTKELRRSASQIVELQETESPSATLDSAADGLRLAAAEIDSLRAQLAEAKDRLSRQNDSICQALGQTLGYPQGPHGVFVGEHVAESLADEAGRRLAAQPAWHDGPARGGSLPENPEEGERIAIVYQSKTGHYWIEDMTWDCGAWRQTVATYADDPEVWEQSNYPIHRWCRFADLMPGEPTNPPDQPDDAGKPTPASDCDNCGEEAAKLMFDRSFGAFRCLRCANVIRAKKAEVADG